MRQRVRGFIFVYFKTGAETSSPLLVTFAHFDVSRSVDAANGATAGLDTCEPEFVTEWLDGVPRLGVDDNDIPMILHIPGWQGRKSLVSCSVSPNFML
jgi:hypothetical protein